MKTVVALYDQISDANAAVRDLVSYGIPRDNISLMASDAAGNYSNYFSSERVSETVTEAMDTTASGAATGAGIGAIIGGLGGLLVGLGVLAVPGVGPVLAAGPLAVAISAITGSGVGAMAGGAAGGLIGALVDLGLPEETAGNYAEGIRRGGTLVTARAEDHQAEEVRRIMNRHNVINLDERLRDWRSQPASDPNVDVSGAGSTPYTEGTETAQARHPEGGMYGGVNTPDESGERTPSAYASSAHSTNTFDWDQDSRFRGFDEAFRTHYAATYNSRGHDYDYYLPAYYYGYQLANNDRYRGWNWNDLEPEARRDWELRSDIRGAWEDFKDAVQHAWMRVKEGVSETFD